MRAPWTELNSREALRKIFADSHEKPQLIFKHSTRCSISRSVLGSLDHDLDSLSERYALHYLDLLSFRDLSDLIAESTGINHESPQVIVLQGGQVQAHYSHFDIDARTLQTS